MTYTRVLSISIVDAWVRADNPLESANPNLSSNSSEFSKAYGTNVLDWAIDGNCSRGLLLGENGAINSSHSCGQNSECEHYLSAFDWFDLGLPLHYPLMRRPAALTYSAQSGVMTPLLVDSSWNLDFLSNVNTAENGGVILDL
ncbi:hypothetical protein LguiA_026293 [Lonicera macranthoides]